jgi:hypothetical protein
LTDAAAEVRGLIATGIDRGAALRQVARRRGLNRREIYRQLVRDRDVGTIDPPRGTGEKAEEEE